MARRFTSDVDALQSLLSGTAEADWFSPTVASRLSPQIVSAVVDRLRAHYGTPRTVEGHSDSLWISFDSATVPASLTLDADGRISALFFRPSVPMLTDAEKLITEYRSLGDGVGILAIRDGREVAAVGPDTARGVGSCFKLAILAAAVRAVEDGRVRWHDVIELALGDRSLPSGVLQDWPVNSPITLHSLVGLMFSVGDNTAADALMSALGSTAISFEAEFREPLFTTREAFLLKSPDNADLRNWLRDRPVDWPLISRQLRQRPLPSTDQIFDEPHPEIEWFTTPRELVRLMLRVKDTPFTALSAGPLRHGGWTKLSFKDGYEPGVVAYVASVVDSLGSTMTAAAAWNTSPEKLDVERFAGLFQALLRLNTQSYRN